MDYLLTCTCGKDTRVSKSQAGQELQCACGQSLKVPTLRGFADLRLVDAGLDNPARTAGEAARSVWSGWRGAIVALATAIALVAGITAGVCLLYRSNIDTSYTAERYIADGNDVIDGYTPVQLSLTWNDFQKFKFGPRMWPAFYVMLQHAERLERWAMISGGVAGLASLVACGVWLTTRRRSLAA